MFPILALACAAVLVILALGLSGAARGRLSSNRLMRWRIIAQAFAIALLLIYLWQHG